MKIVARVAVFVAATLLSCFVQAQASPSAAGAVVPRLVNFAGKAVDDQGKVLSGIVGITFAIYKDQDGGSALWLESQNVQADSKGNYTAQLGATKPDGLPLDLFTSGEARWLGVTVNGGQEQARILLLSVPYALKAADAETVGGLPASAFVLAAPTNPGTTSANAISSSSASSLVPPNSAVTGLGSANFLPLWDSTSDIINSAVFQSGSGNTAKVGINTSTPSSTLDVHGGSTLRGNLSLPSIGIATASSGKVSQPTTFTASSFNSGTSSAVSQNFRWQAEPTGNNTIVPSGTLNLLFGSGTNSPKETGLKIASNGLITFANSQVFPGTGTITGVTAGTDLLGGGTSGTLTLNLDTTKVPQLAANNNFVGDQSVIGNFGVLGDLAIETNTPDIPLDVLSSTTGLHTPIARFGSNGVFDSNSILTYNGTGTTEIFQSGCNNCFMLGAQPGDGGIRVNSGKKIFFGDSSGQPRLALDSAGNASQPRTANGTVKAMLKFSPFNGGAIKSCFNSTLSDDAATTPPCGFTFRSPFTGQYIFGFGFQVDDRILSATGAPGGPTPFGTLRVCTDLDGCTVTNQQVEVDSRDFSENVLDQKVYLIVY